MFDTMTITKTLGGFAGALLVFLLGSWAAETLYSAGSEHGEEAEQAYVIDTGEEEVVEVQEAVPDFAAILASADAVKGEGVFRKCAACHALTAGQNRAGPTLFGLVGRDIGSVEGFGYSGTLEALEGDWTPEALSGFLEDPRGYAPGTGMSFSGLKKIEDRANLIAFLQTIN